MTTPGSKLPQGLLESIFRNAILPDSGYLEATSQTRPRAIILAGQPGAGKGRIADSSMSDLGRNAVTVDPDELRDYHPNVQRTMPPGDASNHSND